MSDYIKREDLKNYAIPIHLSRGEGKTHYFIPLEFVKDIPAAPVREAVRGKWVWDYYHGRYCCSKCGAASPQEDQNGEYICRPKFCHCCGADMR